MISIVRHDVRSLKKKESLSLTYDPNVKMISIVRHDNARSQKKDSLSLTYDPHVKIDQYCTAR